MDYCINAFRSSSTKEVIQHLTQFNLQNEKSMSIDEPLLKKKQMVEGLIRYLRDEEQRDHHVLVLTTLRIMSRDNKNLETLFTADRIETLLHMANLVGEEEAYMTDSCKDFEVQVVVEAQKTLCNLIFNNSVIQRLCCHNSTIDGILLRMRMYKDPNLPLEVKYYDMRMLFLLTALCRDLRPRIREEFHGLVYLMEAVDLVVKNNTSDPNDRSTKKSLRKRKGSGRKTVMGGSQKGHHSGSAAKSVPEPEPEEHLLTDEEVAFVVEVLKVLFNLTCFLGKNIDEKEEAQFMRLVAILHDLLLSETKSKEKREEIQSHTTNLLTNMPHTCFDELLVPVEEIGLIDNPLYEYEDSNVEAIAVLVEFLEKRLIPIDKPSRSTYESLGPILICLSEMSRAKRVIRKYLKSRILPPLKDVMKRPEEGQTIRNKMVKLMTNPDTDVKELVADLLFVLCKENVGRLIKYTGYGNAAGLLAKRGLMLGGQGEEYSSESEDSDTDEYLQYKDKINPVIGCYEETRPSPLEGMSDEQKEYEAMELLKMMEKMTRTGIVKPCRIGDDGKPHPVEHILQLRDDNGDKNKHDDSS